MYYSLLLSLLLLLILQIEELAYKVRGCQNNLNHRRKLQENKLKRGVCSFYTYVKPCIMKLSIISDILHYITQCVLRLIDFLNGRGNI